MKKQILLFLILIPLPSYCLHKNTQKKETLISPKEDKENLPTKNLKLSESFNQKPEFSSPLMVQSFSSTQTPVKKLEPNPISIQKISSKNPGISFEQVMTHTRSITLHSEITEKSITYDKHWYKPYPSDFKVFINEQEYMSLKNGKPMLHEKVFNIASNKIKVTYQWALNKFGKLWHTEKKEIEFEVPPEKKEFNMKFSWETDNRITIDSAKMTLCAEIESDKK